HILRAEAEQAFGQRLAVHRRQLDAGAQQAELAACIGGEQRTVAVPDHQHPACLTQGRDDLVERRLPQRLQRLAQDVEIRRHMRLDRRTRAGGGVGGIHVDRRAPLLCIARIGACLGEALVAEAL
ncbi:hypothetical protein RZS08_48285, partial [Arthrospira platensis SPKY1]|nr:hypothetical protein [Arthrospira platensis SPKY1]